MTKSQIYSAVFTLATIVSSVCAAVLPQIESLPPQYRFYGSVISIIGAAASAVVVALNQSLHPGHVSIPVETALDVGLVRKIGGDIIRTPKS